MGNEIYYFDTHELSACQLSRHDFFFYYFLTVIASIAVVGQNQKRGHENEESNSESQTFGYFYNKNSIQRTRNGLMNLLNGKIKQADLKNYICRLIFKI